MQLALFLHNYQFKVKAIKGSENVCVDYLDSKYKSSDADAYPEVYKTQKCFHEKGAVVRIICADNMIADKRRQYMFNSCFHIFIFYGI